MRKLLVALGLLLLVAGCRLVIEGSGGSVGFGFGYQYGQVIRRFEPDRGPGGVYRVGEEVRFFLDLARPGYVTLMVTDPDGRRYAIETARWLPAGWNELPPRWAGYRYTADYPTGLHTVTAYYGSTRGSVTFTFEARSGGYATAGLRVDQRRVEDRAVTTLYVVP